MSIDCPAGVAKEVQSLSPSALIELFELDLTSVDSDVLYFHAGTNGVSQNVVWQGQEYVALPIEAEGFDIVTKGTLPRPKIRIANIDGLFSAEVSAHNDLVGCKVTRRRTFARFLDAVNFPSGNPEADPTQHFADDLWYVDQKVSENRHMIEWELASVFDLEGVMLPGRQVIQNTCPWRYRGSDCGWVGGYFNKSDQPCAAADDFCSKRLSGCRARFESANLSVRFGGFPGSVRYG